MWSANIFAFLVLAVVHSSGQYYDGQARNLLDVYDREIRQAFQPLEQLMRQPGSRLTDEQELERFLIAAGGVFRLLNVGKEIKRYLAPLPVDSFSDKDLKRVIKRLMLPSINDLNETEINEVMLVNAGAQSMAQYRAKLYKGLAQPSPEAVLNSWRQVINETKVNFDNVGTFMKIISGLARLGGFAKPSDYYYAEYDNPNMIQVFESLINEIKPFYEKIHAYIRHKLVEVYGPHVVSESEGIPIHLYEKVMAFGWKKNGLLGSPYPDQECPNYDQALAQQRYTPQKLYDLAARSFFETDERLVEEEDWREMFIDNRNDSCIATVFPLISTAPLIERCEGVDFGRFLEAHGTMASYMYFAQQRGLPVYARGEACPGIADALGYAMALSASSPKYLSKKGIVPNHSYNEQLAVNRQFRMGVRFLMELHMHFVHEKLLVELMNREISPRQTNCRYWELMNQYAGVIPPNGKANARDLDLSVLFYEAVDLIKTNTRRVFSEPMSYNFYYGTCKAEGMSVQGSTVDNCDISGHSGTARIITYSGASGIVKTWDELLGEMHLKHFSFNGEGINEYYRKLSDWLQRTNRNNRAREGWNIRRNCH